jgi:hypothetical protein
MGPSLKRDGGMNNTLERRLDGIYEEFLAGTWRAEYVEAADTGLWSATVYKHDVSEWHRHGYASLDEARQAVREYYDSL